MTSQKPTIGFAGLTHLGQVMAASAAKIGYPVIGYHPGDWTDIQSEPGLAELWDTHKHNITRALSTDGLSECELVFVTLDTPLSEQSRPDEKPVLQMVEKVIPFLRDDAVLVIMSQVSPGFTRRLDFPKERLFYQAETLIFGESVNRAAQPNRLIVGCADLLNSVAMPQTSRYPRHYNEYLLSFGCPVHTMRYESAEMAKIAINMMLISQVSTTNTLSELCEHVGADWQEVVRGLKEDRRIGTYLSPGLGLGGGHIERDLRAVQRLCHKHDVDCAVPHAFLDNSEYRRSWLWETLISCTDLWRKEQPRIAILGLAYKPNTASVINSPGVRLAQMLSQCIVTLYDPMVPPEIQAPLGMVHSDPMACLDDSDALVIATPWDQFKRLEVQQIVANMNGKVIIDPYRMLDGQAIVRRGFEYHTLGVKLPLS